MELRRLVDPGVAGPLRLAVAALVALTLLRLYVAAWCRLSPDEAYYWLWSRHLQAGYLDHPAMTALWIRAGTAIAGPDGFGIRLSAPVSAAFGSVALAVAGRDFGRVLGLDAPRRAGLWAALLLNATLALGAGGVIITPDTPLLLFWTLALAGCGRLLATGRGVWWLAIGLAIGLALDSKYTALLTGAGLAGWLLATRPGRIWLRTPWPWLGGAIALAVFAPTLWWNATHGWASLLKQGGRTGAWHPTLRYLGELIGGQVGLATPLVALVFILGGIALWRARRQPSGAASLLLWTILLPAAVFLQHALGDRVQANWPVLVYPALAIAGGVWCASSQTRNLRWLPVASLVCAALLVAPVYLQATLAPLSLPPKLDVTLARLAGWRELATAIDRAAPAGLPIAADEYGLAAELAHDLPPGRVVLGAEPRWALFDLPTVAPPQLVLVRRLRRNDPPDSAAWQVGAPFAVMARCRGDGACADRYALYLVTPGPAPVPMAVLPRR